MCKKLIYLVTYVFVVTIVTNSVCIADDLNPNPADGGKMTDWEAIITWKGGDYAASYNIYFGSNEEAVRNANTGSPDYKGSKDIGSESYKPGRLEFNKTYFWRVDEVNDPNPDSPWVGSVLSFSTGDYFVLENFEDYNDTSNRISKTWMDGFGYGMLGDPNYNPGNGTGCKIGVDSQIFRGGSQSMWCEYDNSGANGQPYSVASLKFDPAQNWYSTGATTASLWFFGNANNAPEPMYFGLEDVNGNSAELFHPDPAATQYEDWTEWTIPLKDIFSQLESLMNVRKCFIGFGDVNNPQPGGSGTMNFDDLRILILEEPNAPTLFNGIGISQEDCPPFIPLDVNNCVPPSWEGPCEYPDPPQDMCSMNTCPLDLSPTAKDRIFGETFPCGEGPFGLTVCASSWPPPSGSYVLLIVQFEGDIPLNDKTHSYQYAFVFDADDLTSNNYEPWPDFPNDFFSYTDKWYELSYVPNFGWQVYVTDVRQNFAQMESNARFVISGRELAIFIPLDEFDTTTPMVRATAFCHTGDYGMSGGPWSGDLSSLIGEPLLPIASVDSIIVVNE